MSNDIKISLKPHYLVKVGGKQNKEIENHVLEVVTEIVEKTCKNEKKNDFNKSPVHEANNLKHIGESDVPVRRSNRIRKSIVKKDEFITPRSKKTNRNSKNDMCNLKDINSEIKNSDVDKNSYEKVSKTKGNISSKSEKNKQNGKRPVQPEKRKPTRKKKCGKAEDISDNNNSSDYESKKDEKQEDPLSTPSDASCNKVVNTESNKHDNIFPKVNEDQTCEANDKSSESCNIKPVKVKSRWWRSSELEAVKNSESLNSDNVVSLPFVKAEPIDDSSITLIQIASTTLSVKLEPIDTLPVTTEKINEISDELKVDDKKIDITENKASPTYDHIEENIYRFNRKKCKSKKQVRRMVCDCTLTKEEQEYGIMGCKEECLNRLLMIECGSRCPIGEACSNKKFQKKEYVKAEIFKTEKKGWGLRTLQDTSAGDFLMEFVGEILNHKEYRQRVKQYAKEKNVHSYFMALKPDEILDATYKGNLSRFINHSCNPNCETQKWTVNGELRVGVFSKRAMQVGEELTLDYQFQRYGREAQKCYCGAENCSGFIGGAKQISIDAYSGSKSLQSRKRKGSEDKKRDFEDMVLEEEIEKLNGNRGLRNRDDTLKLARLMVRADDSATRHQLLDIILKTEEQACLRLFLDYHGLPLLWSWMTDIVEYDLKAKILQVLSLLPISNKTMLLDSKVMSIVEKWHLECSSKSKIQNELPSIKSSTVITSDDTTDSGTKKNQNH